MGRIEPYVSAIHDDADSPYHGVGAELRAAREAVGQSADQIASALRIRRKHVEAIEDGRFQDLPGQVYAVGFIRAYADYLELDSDIVIARFHEEADGPEQKLELHFPEPAIRRSRLDLRALLVGLIIAVGAYGVWNYLQTDGEMPRELVAVVPPNLLVSNVNEPESAPTETTQESGSTIFMVPSRSNVTSQSVDEGSDMTIGAPTMAPQPPTTGLRAVESEQSEPAIDDPVPEESDIAEAEPEAEATETEPDELDADAVVMAALAEAEADLPTDSDTELPPMSDALEGFRLGETVEAEPGSATAITGALVETPEAPTIVENEMPSVPAVPSVNYEPRIYGQGNTDARVVVRARIESWVQIEGSNNELLLTRVLNPGDMFLVPNRGDLRLVTGNAGGIEILVDGELLPPLGPEGTVRRNIRLTPDALTGADTVSAR